MNEFNNENLNSAEENGVPANENLSGNANPETANAFANGTNNTTETTETTETSGINAAAEAAPRPAPRPAPQAAPQATPQAAPQAEPQATPQANPNPQGNFAGQSGAYVPPCAAGSYANAGAQGTGAQGTGAQGTQYNPYSNPNPNPNPNPGYTVNASGEYRYIPPYAPAGAHNAQMPPQYRPATVAFQSSADAKARKQQEKLAKREKKKAKKCFSAAAVAWIVVACVLLSFGAGMGGALLANKLGTGSGSGSMVIYKQPENNKSDSSASDKNGASSVGGSVVDLSDVCAKVSESVVEIETEFKNTYGFYQYVDGGAGSGVVISADGYVITNNHVIFNSQTNKIADSVTVRLSNGKEYKATVVGRDSDADIALLKVDAADLSPAVVGDSSSLRVGESVIAVGNPLGKLGGTVTSGIISATNREITVENNKMNLIQMDAAINPGNSGGGMFNMKGELVGIVNAKSSGSSIDGLGFAIPVNDAMTVVEELQQHGYVTGKTFIGISLVDVTDNYTAYYYFRSQQTGVYIAQVEEGYNSSVLKYGDRILAVDGKEVSSSENVKTAVKQHKVGDVIKMSVSRDGKIIEVSVNCYEYVPEKDVTFGGEKG